MFKFYYLLFYHFLTLADPTQTAAQAAQRRCSRSKLDIKQRSTAAGALRVNGKTFPADDITNTLDRTS